MASVRVTRKYKFQGLVDAEFSIFDIRFSIGDSSVVSRWWSVGGAHGVTRPTSVNSPAGTPALPGIEDEDESDRQSERLSGRQSVREARACWANSLKRVSSPSWEDQTAMS